MLLILALNFWVVGVLSPSFSVYAHANLVKADPAPNSVLEQSPGRVVIWFTEPIEPKLSEIKVLDAVAARVDDEAPRFDPNDPTVMSVGLGPMADGTYTVAWKNVSTIDGHRVRGSFAFSVGEPITEAVVEGSEGPLLQSPVEPVLRWLALVGVLAMLGGLVFDLFVARPVLVSMRAQAAVRNLGSQLTARSFKLTWSAVCLFALASVLHLLLQSALIHEVSFSAAIGAPVWSTLRDTAWGGLWAWRMSFTAAFCLVLAALLLARGKYTRDSATPGGGAARTGVALEVLALGIGGGILWTLSLASHGAATSGIRNAALVSDFVHLLAAAVWVGALFHLFVAITPILLLRGLSQRQRRDLLTRAVPRFSVIAGLSVAVLIVTGLFNGWAQVTVPAALDTTYGQALVLKVALVGLLLVLGAVNLLWVRPGLGTRDGRGPWLKRFVAAEVVLAVLVLGAVGVLTSLEPARQVASREGIGVPEAPLLEDTNEGAAMSLKVEPATVGPNTLTIRLEDRLGNPIDNASDVRIRVRFVDTDLGDDTASATPAGDGVYVLEGVLLSIAGAWQAELFVSRPDAFDARTAFRFEVTGSGTLGSWAIAPSPGTANLLAGTGLAVLGVVFMVVGLRMGGWFTKAGAGVMAPGIAALVVGVVLLVNAPFAQPGPELVNLFPPDPESLATGQSLYTQTCQTCHGETGRGDGPLGVGLEPPPADLVVHVPLHTEGDLFTYIHDGIPGTAMTPLGDALSDDEIWHVINYIRTLEE